MITNDWHSKHNLACGMSVMSSILTQFISLLKPYAVLPHYRSSTFEQIITKECCSSQHSFAQAYIHCECMCRQLHATYQFTLHVCHPVYSGYRRPRTPSSIEGAWLSMHAWGPQWLTDKMKGIQVYVSVQWGQDKVIQVHIGQTDRKQIRSRINNWCGTFWPRRPLSRMLSIPTWPKRLASVVIDSATYLLMISSPNIDNVAVSLYDITSAHIGREIKRWVYCMH